MPISVILLLTAMILFDRIGVPFDQYAAECKNLQQNFH